ncbi:sugar transferase [Alkalibacterium sp. f15]|uniref:sugar transferase n=1 Tax=Alkalibacterium sp. f15 TaxID=3414029 RepID=UPI003BF816BA
MNYYKWKSILDFQLALVLLFISSPILIIVSLLIKLEDPSGPVIFRQPRIGKNKRVFTLYKLRSMRVELYKDGKELSDSERMLRSGKFIRKTSLDELPQLVNILKGEMSFIGPRPLTVNYLPYYTERENQRHDIKPGISGWAQVNGRNSVNWEEKFELDLYYLDNMSINLDAKILFLTIKKVLTGCDIIESGQKTNQSFIEYRLNQKV